MSKKLQIGDNVSLTKAFSEQEVRQFAELSTDKNPLHRNAGGTQHHQLGVAR